MPRGRKSKNLMRYEPPSPSLCSSDEEQDRDKYFLGNPDYEFDELPQPFRLIDRILEEILDAVNTGIEKVEEFEKLRNEATAVPVCSETSHVHFQSFDKNLDDYSEDYENNCEDGMTFQKLLMSVTMTTVYSVKDKELQATDLLTNKAMCNMAVETDESISLLKTVAIKIQQSSSYPFSYIDLIFVFNDKGECFIYGRIQNCLVPLQALVENQNISSTIIDCSFCADGHLVYFIRFSPSSGYSFEVYKIPTENWVSDLLQEFRKINTETDNINLSSDVNIDNEDASLNAAESKPSLKITDEKEENAVPQITSSFLKQSSTQLVLIAAMTPPTVKPCSSGNLYAHMRSLDIGKVGTGDKHPLSVQFFNTLREELRIDIENKPSNSGIDINNAIDLETAIPTVNFLLATDSINPVLSKDDPKSCRHDFVGVWWSKRNKFMIYNLVKSSKDAELSLEAVYLNSENIINSSISRDTSLVALALQNGNIVIWNRISGAPSQVLNLEESIDFCLFGSLPVESNNVNALLTASKDGTLKKICYHGECLTEQSLLDTSIVQQSEVLHVSIAAQLDWLAFVARAPNFITAFDLESSHAVCHFELPQGYKIDKSAAECFAINPHGTKMFVLTEKEHENGDLMHGILSFSLYGFCYNMKTENSPDDLFSPSYLNAGNLEAVAMKSLNKIKHEQKYRKEIQKRRWKEYESELKLLSKKFEMYG